MSWARPGDFSPYENFEDNCFYADCEFFVWRFFTLKGQSHEKVGEMRVEVDSLGPN
jgi:hypothetical protein